MTPVPFILFINGRIVDSAETEEEAIERSSQWARTGAVWHQVHSDPVPIPELGRDILSKQV